MLYSPDFAKHNQPGHPENQIRLDTTLSHLQSRSALDDRPEIEFEECSLEIIERVHDSRYVEGLATFAMDGGGWLDADTYVGQDSFGVARLAAGAAVAAVESILEGRVRRGFVLARPPGHHATAGRGMGFCLFNTVSVVASHALNQGLERVAIVDWDVHHGNGTQDIFYESDRVLYCSVHQFPFYPGTGAASERGSGRGEGHTVNVPLPAGSGDDQFLEAFGDVLAPRVRKFAPELVLISAGFDAHFEDPLGGLEVTEAGFVEAAKIVATFSDEYADARLLAVLEGGYAPDALARSVEATLAVFDGLAV